MKGHLTLIVKTVMSNFSKFVGLKLSQLLRLLLMGTLNMFHYLPWSFCYVLTFLPPPLH